jgi:adenine-specific DNA-methyltransferase
VNEKTLTITSFGDPISKVAKRTDKKINGSVPIWPIDKLGVERNWHYGPERAKKELNEGKLFAARQDYGIQIYYTLREKQTKRWKTVWSKPTLDASTYASELLIDIFGNPSGFSYPKSVYAVCESLMPAILKRKNGVVVDFFAGSGTTLHATVLLNSEDGGKRHCILVTNNEVNEKLTLQLQSNGLDIGDSEFDKYGIAESITWPRCKYVINGQRDNSQELPGTYVNGRALKMDLKKISSTSASTFLTLHKSHAVMPFKQSFRFFG